MTVSRATRDVVTTQLLEAKLQPVLPRPGIVDRDRVVTAILARPAPPVVALMAPAGYGKTTVLAQWAARERRPVAWLTLDAVDNDPAIFIAYLGAALQRILPDELGLDTIRPTSRERILASSVPRLLAALHRGPATGLLVLDDVHRLEDRTCLDALTAFVDHLPPRFRVALSGRTEPGIPMARLRAQRVLLEVGPAELALDEQEASALTAAAGRQLSPPEVHELVTRTEGWAAGIYLATLARGRGEADGGIASVSGADRYIAAYLRSELEWASDPDDLRFLTRTSLLDGVAGPVAERVSGLPSAADRLQRLARRNLLIQEVGDEDGSYRYHKLLRDFLGAELERIEPGATPAVHRLASAWYEEAGDIDRAFDHAIAGGDVDAAARIASESSETLYRHGRLATLERWLGAFPDGFADRHGPLAVLATWVYLLTGHSDAALRSLDAANRSTAADGSTAFHVQRSILRALAAVNGPREMLADAAFAVDASPDGPWRHQALWMMGAAQLLLGNTGDAERWLTAAVADGRQIGAVAVSPMAMLAGVALRARDVERAENLIRDARERIRRASYEEVVISLPVYAVGARLAAQRGDMRSARDQLVRAQLVRPLAGHMSPWMTVFSLLELARAYLAVSDPAGAQLAVREAEAIVRIRPALGTLTDEVIEVRKRLAGATSTLAGSSTLTAAELRVLPLLPTYLSFAEIADRLQVSRNTVKTHAMSIYGKLWASSRGEAVERAVELGLLEPYPGLEPPRAYGSGPAGAGDDLADELGA
jgi:LuxR family maltose regulon positive regulatory protein